MECKNNYNNQDQKVEYRKVQAIHGNSTFVLVLPKDFVSILDIGKGDYVKCSILDNRIVVEKIED
jgi:hypothetical protein